MAKKSLKIKKFSPVKLAIMAVIVIALVASVGLVKKIQDNRSQAAWNSGNNLADGSYDCTTQGMMRYCNNPGSFCGELGNTVAYGQKGWVEVVNCKGRGGCADNAYGRINGYPKKQAWCRATGSLERYSKPCPSARFMDGVCIPNKTRVWYCSGNTTCKYSTDSYINEADWYDDKNGTKANISTPFFGPNGKTDCKKSCPLTIPNTGN